MFLNSVTSELLMPGPRTTSFGELPGFPRGGRANAAGLNQPVRPGSESVGSPTSSGTPQPAAGADRALAGESAHLAAARDVGVVHRREAYVDRRAAGEGGDARQLPVVEQRARDCGVPARARLREIPRVVEHRNVRLIVGRAAKVPHVG